MIGGKVIEVAEFPEHARDSQATHRFWVMGIHGDEPHELAVHAHNNRGVRLPEIGETIWWQCGRIRFGGPDPKNGEISWRKVGNSYDPRNVINRCPA